MQRQWHNAVMAVAVCIIASGCAGISGGVTAGLEDVDDTIELLAGLKNVSVDISFQSPGKIRELIKAFGAERVLYASDWPYGNRIPAVKAVKAACRGDWDLERLIFYENAATLLGMDV